MSASLVTKPYQHDVQTGGTPMVPSSYNPQIGGVPAVNPDGTNILGGLQNTLDTITSYPATDAVMNGTTALTPKFAKIVASASGVTTIVAAVTSKKIRVLGMKITANAAVNVKWQSHVTPTDLVGLDYLGANGGAVLPFSPVGWFETVVGEALDINLSAAVAVGGHLTYVEV